VTLVLFLVTPWWSVDWSLHWENVRWIPFTSPLRRRDIVLNVLLYVPVGYWHLRATGHSVWRSAAFALLLSTVTEASQLFSARRFPSATDVTTNLIGGLCGASYARWACRPEPK
jgi:glycopeptide antibiotics resistance protein